MISISKKDRTRIGQIVLNTAYSMVMRFQTFVWSALVIAYKDIEFWGHFVPILVTYGLCSHFVKFGNGGYLLKEFSLQPSSIMTKWWSVLKARTLLLIIVILTVLLISIWELEVRLLVSLWLVLSFIYQSFDVLIQYNRSFIKGFLVELIGVVVILIFVCLLEITLVNLLLTGIVMTFAKVILLGSLFWKRLTEPLSFKIELKHFKYMSPFFIIGIVGLLNSRIDLYVVSYFETSLSVGRYQVFINLVMIFMSGVHFIASPYTKNLYRLNRKGLNKVITRLFMLGSTLGVLWLCFNWLLLTYVYQQVFSFKFYILGLLLVLPIYLYYPLSIRLFKTELGKRVTYINIMSVIINLALNILLIPHYHLFGALIGTVVSQWFLFCSYIYLDKKIVK